jgi:hypothetical protein
MASWMPLDFQTPIAVHELTHALQDQHFDLEEVIKIKSDHSDLQLARAALVEGDASALMLDFSHTQTGGAAIETLSTAEIQSYSSEMIDSMQSVTGAKHGGLDQLLVFPYSAGLNFVHKLLKTEGYAALNAAYKRLPRSTEEILHFDKYLEEQPSFIKISDADVISGLSNKELQILYSDTYGEFFIRVWLTTLGVSAESAELAAAGWGGDRVVVVKTKDRNQVRWKINWDSSRDADQFFGIVSPALQKLSLNNSDSKVKLRRKDLEVLLVAEF